MHYAADWVALVTEKISDDKYYDYYRAESPSLSVFAIVVVEEKKSFVKMFTPGLVGEEVTGFSVKLKEYAGVSVFSLVGLFSVVLLLIVKSRLKKKISKRKRVKR